MMTTAEMFLRAVSGEGIERDIRIFAAGLLPSAQGTTKIKATAMNRQNHPELIVSGIHLELTQSLKTFVQEKADRLFRHEERILRMRVELESDPKEKFAARFKAKGHVIIDGPALNATVESDECHKAVALLADKLDRMLSRRAQLLKSRRHRMNAIEFGEPLPKAI